MTGLPIVPLGLACTAGVRLRSWDRSVVPAPFARIFLWAGESFEPGPDGGADLEDDALAEALGRRITRTVRMAEAVAAEARRGRPYAVIPVADAPGRPVRAGGPREAAERRLREAWRRPPRIGLRFAAAGFSAARAARAGLFRAGALAVETPSLPVISVGGATVGGSGKTPLAIELTGWLEEAGHRVAILTRGYADEMRLHRTRRPEAIVLGHPDRAALARRAAAAGATAAVLDDGFQHFRLGRDLDLLALDRDALRRTNRAALPAGPFREPPETAIRRAAIVVMIGREPWSTELEDFDAAWLDRVADGQVTASVTIEAGRPRHVRGPSGDGPRLALTGIMKPNLFFQLARRACPTLVREHTLPDHGEPGGEWPELLTIAGGGGILMTGKDLMRLSTAVPEEVPIWVLPEAVRWHRGREAVRERVLSVAGSLR